MVLCSEWTSTGALLGAELGVEPFGQVPHELDPVEIARMPAVANDDEVGGWVDVDELAVITVREVGRTALVDPPQVLVFGRGVGRHVLTGGFGDEVRRHDLAVTVATLVQVHPAELGEVDRSSVDPDEHLLEFMAVAVEAPVTIGLGAHWLPEAAFHVLRDGHSCRPFQDQPEQDDVPVVVVKHESGRSHDAGFRDRGGPQIRAVVGVGGVGPR